MSRPDVLVIGGGVIGSSIAYACVLEGLDVLLLDRRAIRGEASGARAGGIRQPHRHPAELPLALVSARRWPHLEAEFEHPLGFVGGGGCDSASAVTSPHRAIRAEPVRAQINHASL